MKRFEPPVVKTWKDIAIEELTTKLKISFRDGMIHAQRDDIHSNRVEEGIETDAADWASKFVNDVVEACGPRQR